MLDIQWIQQEHPNNLSCTWVVAKGDAAEEHFDTYEEALDYMMNLVVYLEEWHGGI